MLRRSALTTILALSAGIAGAEPIMLKRGLNGELWYNWGSIAELQADPEALAVFPDWRRHLTPSMFAALSEQGFDFIRMPTDPGPALAAGPGAEQDRLIDGMIEAVRIGLDVDLKVILDLHPLPRGDEVGGIESLLGDHFPDYVALVGRIAARLAELPQDRVALELLNEPSFDCEGVYAGAPPKWPAMQAELHAAARAAASDLTIILTGACWGQAKALASLDPGLIADDTVLWTFHSYVPFAFSHQGAGWTGAPVRYLSDLAYPPSRMTPETVAQVIESSAARMAEAEGTADIEAITREVQDYAAMSDSYATDDIDVAVTWADAHGVPRDRILLGEFGAMNTVFGKVQPPEWYHDFLADKRRAAEAAGMGWAILSWTGEMGVADPASPDRRLSPGTCRALGLPCGN